MNRSAGTTQETMTTELTRAESSDSQVDGEQQEDQYSCYSCVGNNSNLHSLSLFVEMSQTAVIDIKSAVTSSDAGGKTLNVFI